MHTASVVKELIRKGVNVQLSPGYTAAVLKECARLAVQYDVHLTINSSGLTAAVAKELATIGQKNVTLIC